MGWIFRNSIRISERTLDFEGCAVHQQEQTHSSISITTPPCPPHEQIKHHRDISKSISAAFQSLRCKISGSAPVLCSKSPPSFFALFCASLRPSPPATFFPPLFPLSAIPFRSLFSESISAAFQSLRCKISGSASLLCSKSPPSFFALFAPLCGHPLRSPFAPTFPTFGQPNSAPQIATQFHEKPQSPRPGRTARPPMPRR